MSDAVDALHGAILEAEAASRELVESLAKLRGALARAYSRSEQLAMHGCRPDRDAAFRLANAECSAAAMSSELTRVMKHLAPLRREARKHRETEAA